MAGLGRNVQRRFGVQVLWAVVAMEAIQGSPTAISVPEIPPFGEFRARLLNCCDDGFLYCKAPRASPLATCHSPLVATKGIPSESPKGPWVCGPCTVLTRPTASCLQASGCCASAAVLPAVWPRRSINPIPLPAPAPAALAGAFGSACASDKTSAT